VRVAAVQHDIFWEDPVATTHRLEGMVVGAAAAGARLIVLPERFATGSSMNPDSVEDHDGPSSTFLRRMAEELDVWICGTIAVRTKAGVVRNEVQLVGPEDVVHRAHKMHLPAGPEADLFTPGARRATFTIDDLRVTPLVGHDIRFPQTFWHAAGDTDVFLVPGAEPEGRRVQWRTLLAARAIENQCYVIGVNRVGSGGGMRHAGDSSIVDPQGEVLAVGAGTETMLLAEVESALVRFTRDRSPLLSERDSAAIVLG
jgi:predicted amidohydrolase